MALAHRVNRVFTRTEMKRPSLSPVLIFLNGRGFIPRVRGFGQRRQLLAAYDEPVPDTSATVPEPGRQSVAPEAKVVYIDNDGGGPQAGVARVHMRRVFLRTGLSEYDDQMVRGSR